MKNWDDDRILNYLMTSDFNDDLSPEDFKYLLYRFRNFYRVVSSRITNNDLEKKKFEYELENLNHQKNQEIEVQKNSYNDLLNIYNSLISRKLSLSERWSGKIKSNSNESL